ncbi:MAG: proline dehydrogenase family protein, partial [Proteobacteria bacterium]|nr:proline dehydrogenase family protein [Pseudomonadota bacterium]
MEKDFESRVRKTGRGLFDLMEEETPSLFNKKFWEGKVIEGCIKDAAFKVELLRFMDVLPHLSRPESVAQHLEEYFGRPGQRLPKGLGLLPAGASSSSSLLQQRAMRVDKQIKGMCRRFIVGTTVEEGLKKLRLLRSQGLAFSADILGEAVVSEKDSEAHVAGYLELLDLLDREQAGWKALGNGQEDLDWGCAAKVNLSIKPSALYSQMNAQAFDHTVSCAKERLRPIFRKAVKMGAHVCLDMEQNALKDLTLAIYRSLLEETEFRGYPHTGTVIQSYLRSSEKDLRTLLAWARKRGQRMTIRLVKGAYWEAERVIALQRNWPIPFFKDKHETDANFEKLARIVMENHEFVGLACASHNVRSIAYVMETARELALPVGSLEYQVLHGMAEPIRTALQRTGVPVRVYTPIGEI